MLERSLKLQSEFCFGESGIAAKKSWLEFMSAAVDVGLVVNYFTGEAESSFLEPPCKKLRWALRISGISTTVLISLR